MRRSELKPTTSTTRGRDRQEASVLETNIPGPRRQVSPIVILALGLVSGAIALAYEVLWTRELLNLLGSTTRASALVLAAFMGGIALGAHVAGRRTVRIGRPLRLFAAAEGALGCIGLVFPLVLRYGAGWIGIGAILDVALLVLLFGPAFLMGVALPALAAALQHEGASEPKYVAALYGLNTLGGAAAAFGVGLMALPMLGLSASTRSVAAVGLLLAIFAWALSARMWPSLPTEATSVQAAGSDIPSVPIARAVVLGALILGGVAALGYEVLWTRILVLIVGSSSTAFALMLGFYLLGLTLGGFAMSRVSGWESRPARAFQLLQLAIAATTLLGAAAFRWLPSAALFGFAQLGTAPASILAVNVVLIAAIIVLPTVFVGASFPVAARLMERDKPRRGREVGLALAITTVGNVGGILLAAFAIVPAVGLQGGVAALAVLNALAALALWLVGRAGRLRRRYAIPAAAFGVGLVATSLPPWDVAVMTSGVFRQAPVYLALLGGAGQLERAFSAYETRYYREGSEAVVAVFDRPTLHGAPHRVLSIDGKVDASTGADMATQVLSGHLPFLFRPDANNALVVGLASGVTVGALANYPFEQIDVVEIEPAVVEASRAFDGVSGAPLDDPRVRVTIADGRRYLAQSRRDFDIIVSEPSNPWLSMSARLFTREFFALASERLKPRGVLVQWIPLYGLSPSQFQALVRTLLDAFPQVALFRVAEGDLVAVASKRPLHLEPEGLVDMFSKEVVGQLQSIGVEKPSDLLARWTADGRALRKVMNGGPLNTDDNGLLEFGSPWYLLADTKSENEALVAQAARDTKVPGAIAKTLLALPDSREALEALAQRYLDRGRLPMLRTLAKNLRALGEEGLADLYAGDALAAEGRWSEAQRHWARHDGPPFWIRLAWASFRKGDADAATRLFAKVPEARRNPMDDIAFALALAETAQPGEALGVLTLQPSAPNNTVSSILGPFVRFVVLDQIAEPDRAHAALREFEHALDGLRRCLETEKCEGVVDDLLRWTRGAVGLDPHRIETLRKAVFLRITRPLPHYFAGVRSRWLGDHDAAAQSFRTYLNLLPKQDFRSKAHELLATERRDE